MTTGVVSATVRTTAGLVRGIEVDGVHTFRGIPYAAAPVGPLRFAAPAPPAPWDGVRDAVEFGPTAPQPVLSAGPAGIFPQTVIDGDECLHVNVHTADPGANALPVLVWIHGGGMVMGSNNDAWTQAARLARRGMVVVAITYRLGVDGFLVVPDVEPNRGVLDWLHALEWVQENVAAFGGDPTNVTVGGQSAGSAACLVLMATRRGAGLFRRVFAMSGVPWNVADLSQAAAKAEELTGRLGVACTADGFASVPRPRLYEVQHDTAPVGGIRDGALVDPLTLFHDVATAWDWSWLGPVIDGDLLPEHPLVAIGAGAAGAVEVVIGSTADEMDALIGVAGSAIERPTAESALLRSGLDEREVTRWFGALADRTPGEVLGAALTALSFRLPIVRVAEARFGAPGRTFVYEVTWRPPTPIGAVHAIDLPYVFDNLDAEGVALMAGGMPPQTLADDMAGAITGLVCDGDPGWPPYEDPTRCVMAFDVPSAVRRDPDRLVRDVFGRFR